MLAALENSLCFWFDSVYIFLSLGTVLKTYKRPASLDTYRAQMEQWSLQLQTWSLRWNKCQLCNVSAHTCKHKEAHMPSKRRKGYTINN